MPKYQMTLTTTEAAHYCSVSFRTIIRWIEKGKLPAYQLPGRGDNRIKIQDFLEFLEKNQIPVPEELIESTKNNAPSTSPNTSPNTSLKIERTRILIIDDDNAMANAIRRCLHNKKYDINIVNNGFEAGTTFISFKPQLMTLDLSMPGMDGLTVLKTIRSLPQANHNYLKILVISALPKIDLDRALQLGADAALSKPFNPKVLKSKVSELLSAYNKKNT